MAPNFEELRASLQEGDVLLPGDAGYDDSLKRWSATCVKPAAAVARPKNASEASTIVRFATKHSISLQVRGGGHNPSGESSARTPEALILDLAHMRTVSVDPSAQTVSYGGGCTWADVDNALWEHGLATVGGTVSHTGVGGLVLGGGYGMLTGRWGLSVDVLLSCEVVLANGEVVTASETENTDLFWALRGAGSSFGVVTTFTSRAFPQGEIWGGIMAWPFELLPQLVEFVNEFHNKTDGDQWFMPMAMCDPQTGARLCGASVFFNGKKEDGEAFYKPLRDLQPRLMDTTGQIPYPKANMMSDAMAVPGRRYMFGGANFTCPLDFQTMKDAAEEFYSGINKPGNEDIRTSSLALELIPQGKISEYAKENKTSFAGREGKYNVAMIMSWDNADRDKEVKDIVTKTSSVFKVKYGRRDGESGGADTYYNYLNPDVPADKALMKTGRLFGEKAPRLRELKAKYDPNNVFFKNVNLMPLAQ
ncbi:FAD binding domain protein [Seiridium cupressi]